MENHINHANPGLLWQLLFIYSPHNFISNSWGQNIRNYVWVTLFHFYVIHPHLPCRRQRGKQQALPVNSNSSVITREKACQESHGQGWIDVPCKSSHPERSAGSVLCLGYHHVSRHKSHLPLNCTFAGFMLTLALGPLCLALSMAYSYLRHTAIWARSRVLLLLYHTNCYLESVSHVADSSNFSNPFKIHACRWILQPYSLIKDSLTTCQHQTSCLKIIYAQELL